MTEESSITATIQKVQEMIVETEKARQKAFEVAQMLARVLDSTAKQVQQYADQREDMPASECAQLVDDIQTTLVDLPQWARPIK